MNEEYSQEYLNEVSAYRMEKAYSALEDADYNAFGGKWDVAINRLYYACYYAATAYLMLCSIVTHTHAGVKSNINKMVRDGVLDRQFSLTFNRMFDMRHESDYDDFVDYDAETVEQYRPLVSSFIEEMHCLINNHMSEG